MTKKPLSNIIGNTFIHKRLGECTVRNLINRETGSVRITVLATNEEKTVLFTPQFFEQIEEYDTPSITIPSKPHHKGPHKPVDLSKYRNHPLVKEIDRRESRRRVIYAEPSEDNTPGNENE